MKKILIIGIKGMAGHVIYHYLKRNETFDVYGMARNITETDKKFSLDVSESNRLKEIIDHGDYDFVINCIGILNKDAEDHPSKAIWFNSYFPHFLEEITKDKTTKIIHISTDCVFSGKKGNYTEEDFKDGVGFYAQSKALGELLNDKDLTIRTSIIGPELNRAGIGLFHWFMTRETGSVIKGFTNAYWSGITTLELAKVITEAIEKRLTGLIQISYKDKIDKYSLLSLMNTLYRKNDVQILQDGDYKVNKSLKSIREDFKYKIPSYEQMLIDQKKWILANELLYPFYKITKA